MTFGDEHLDTCDSVLGMFHKTFDLLKIDWLGSVAAPGCVEKGVVNEEYRESAERLAASIA